MYICICSALLYSDAPYGLTGAEWDVVWSGKKLDKILKQFGATQLSERCVACIWVNPMNIAEYTEVLKNNEYIEANGFYWHKKNHHTPTGVNSYTSSVEQAIIAYKPYKAICAFNMDPNPRKRHNFIEHPSVTKYELDDSRNPINKCQKPPEISRTIASHHCMPGDWVLNVGPGAGGCLLGLIQAGVNVVAVESDVKQFKLLQGTAYRWKDEGLDQLYSDNKEDNDNEGDDDDDDENPIAQSPASVASNRSAHDPDLSTTSAASNLTNISGTDGDSCTSCAKLFLASESKVVCESGDCGPHEYYHEACTRLLKKDGDDQRWCVDCVSKKTFEA